MKSTKKLLKELTDIINALTQPNNYELAYKDGGAALMRAGTEENVFGCGFATKKNLHHRMEAFICGLQTAKK